MLELWGIRSTPSLPLLPGPLRPGVVVPDRVLSMGQIELKCVLMLNWITWNRTFWIFKLCTYAKLNCLKWNFLTLKLYLCLTELFEIELIICIKMNLALNNLQRLICHKPKQPTNQINAQKFSLSFSCLAKKNKASWKNRGNEKFCYKELVIETCTCLLC